MARFQCSSRPILWDSYTQLQAWLCFQDCVLPESYTRTMVSVRSTSAMPRNLSNTSEVLMAGNLVPIVNAVNASPRYRLGACVKVIPPSFRNYGHMLEFFEYYRMMGVEHFTVYSNSTDPGVNCILDTYVDIGIVEVIDFKLDMDPVDDNLDIPVNGAIGSLVDCAYRRQYQYEYLMYDFDFDEFLVPRLGESNILGLLETAEMHDNVSNPYAVGSYTFQNAFFWVNSSKNEFTSGQDWQHPRIDDFGRSTYTDLIPWRSKSILVPRNVDHPGIHAPERLIKGKIMVKIDSSLAVVQHYRIRDPSMSSLYPNTTVVDDEAARPYANKLKPRLHLATDHVLHKCRKVMS